MPSFCRTLTLLAITLTLLLSVGCTSDSNSDDASLDAAHDTEQRDGDPSDGGSCNVGVCDAIYIPSVVMNFEDPSGAEYCGDVVVTWWTEGEPEDTREKTCTCANADGADAGTGGADAGGTRCEIDANAGETTVIEAKAEGYATYQTTVTLPCTCHPQDWFSVQFEQE